MARPVCLFVYVLVRTGWEVACAGYPLVEGREGTPEALKALQAKLVVPLLNDSVTNTGVLSQVLTSAGTGEPREVTQWLAAEGVSGVTVAGPQSFGQPVPLCL